HGEVRQHRLDHRHQSEQPVFDQSFHLIPHFTCSAFLRLARYKPSNNTKAAPRTERTSSALGMVASSHAAVEPSRTTSTIWPLPSAWSNRPSPAITSPAIQPIRPAPIMPTQG